jgi:hypothetical protein
VLEALDRARLRLERLASYGDDEERVAHAHYDADAAALRELAAALDDPEVIVALRRRADWQDANGGHGAAERLRRLAARLLEGDDDK